MNENQPAGWSREKDEGNPYTEKMNLGLRTGIYIITGIMASGKSTIAQMLSEQFERGVHVHGDVFRRMIVNGRMEMTPGYSESALQQLLLRYRITVRVAEMYYDAGFSVVVQDVYLGKVVESFLDEFTSTPVYLITLNPSVEAVKDRERNRSKKGYTVWDVEALHKALNTENPKIGLWIDTTDLSPEKTVSQIIQRAEPEARIR